MSVSEPNRLSNRQLQGQDLPARRHKANCFRANGHRPYESNDSIIHVLTHPLPLAKIMYF